MKINLKRIIYTVVILSIFMLPSCKEALKVQLYDIWGVGIKVIGEEKSNFSAYVNIINETPQLEGGIIEWSFKIYSGDTVVLEIDNNNYRDLGYQVNIQIPAPNYYYGGNMTLRLGIPFFESNTVFVDTDIFAGKKPDKFDFRCIVRDIRGDDTEITSLDTPMQFLEHDPS